MEAGGSPRSGRRLEAAYRVPARIHDLTGPRSRAASRVSWVGGEPSACRPAGGPEGRILPPGERKAEEREPRRRSRGACGEGQFRAGPRLSRAAAPGADSGPGWQRRVEESSCAVGDARVSGGPGPLPLGGTSHAGRKGAFAAGRLRFGFAAAAALLADGTRDT